MLRSRAYLGLIVLSLSGVAAAQITGANGVVVNPYVFADFPNSNFNYSVSYPSVTFNDPDVNASGQGTGSGNFANRHTWWLSTDGGTTAATLSGPNDFFSYSFSISLTADGGSRKEAGILLTTGAPSQLDGQFIITSDFGGNGGEVAAFGGAFPFYSFTVSNLSHYNDGDVVTMGLNYKQDTADNVYKFQYRYQDQLSPWMALGNGFDSTGLNSGTHVGAYLQIPKNSTDINATNGATAIWNNISVAPVPEPASFAALGLGLLAFTRKRRKS